MGELNMAEERKEPEIKEEFIALSEVIQKPAAQKEYLSAEDLTGKQFVIFRVAFYQGEYGDYAVVETDMGWLRTSSKVLLKQLRFIDKVMEERKLKGVRVKLTKRKSAGKRFYYVFE
jgi:hypothetical protein